MFWKRAPAPRGQLHQRADVPVGSHHAKPHPRLLDGLDLADVRELGGVVHRDDAAVHRQQHAVLDRRRARNEVEVELALETLLDDLHVEEAEEAAPEAEAERHRRLRLIGEACVVEVELLEGVAEQRIVRTAERVETREHEALCLLVSGEWLRRRRCHGGHRVADLGLAHVLEAGRHVADLAGNEAVHRHQLGPEHAKLQELRLGAAGHHADHVVVVERPLGQAHVADDTLVRVVVRVEDEPLERQLRVPLRGRDPVDDGLEDLGDTRPFLRGGEDDLLTRDREDALQLLHDDLGLGRRKIDLVDDRDDRETFAQGEVDVGQRLRLDALRSVDDEDGALAGLQAPADLVCEVHVPGSVDQVEAVHEAVVRGVLEAHGPGLDRDALLALEVHGVQNLAHHLPALDRVGQLEQAVGERGLAVIDVRDDREVAHARLGDGHEAGV